MTESVSESELYRWQSVLIETSHQLFVKKTEEISVLVVGGKPETRYTGKNPVQESNRDSKRRNAGKKPLEIRPRKELRPPYFRGNMIIVANILQSLAELLILKRK